VDLVWGGPDGVIGTTDDITYTTTTSGGVYHFCGLPSDPGEDGAPDQYQVVVPDPPGNPVTRNVGDDDEDNDGDPNGKCPVFTIPNPTALPTGSDEDGPGDSNHPEGYPSEQDDLTIDFGFDPFKVAIGNFVWHDANNNSQVDSGESGIDGITVTLYRDVNSNGVCEPDVDTKVASIDTLNGGFYQFLDVEPSTDGTASTYYCVVVDQQDVENAGYDYSSTGGNHNPDTTGDHDAAHGDDGVPEGDYVISEPFAAIVGGQTVADSGDPTGYDDADSYMTVDFGFLADADVTGAVTTAVSLRWMQAGRSWHGWAFGLLVLIGLSFFLWRRKLLRSF